jgi:hypothetical protein
MGSLQMLINPEAVSFGFAPQGIQNPNHRLRIPSAVFVQRLPILRSV